MTPAVTYTRLDEGQALARISALRAVYAAVFSQPPYNEGPEMPAKFETWLRTEAGKPGFAMITADTGQHLAGFAYGYTMRAGEWWRNTDRAAPSEVKAAEKFAVMEWAVLPEHRRQGIGQTLMHRLLRDRTEPWATLTVDPRSVARSIYEQLGWSHVATTHPRAMPAMDIMTRKL